MAFTVWVELEVAEGQLENFLSAIRKNQQATLAEPGCSHFDLIRLDREGQWFAFYEIYRDADAFYVEHRNYPHYLEWREAVAETVVTGSQKITAGERLTA